MDLLVTSAEQIRYDLDACITKLRVAMPAHFGRRCVVPILLELAQRNPALELNLSLSDRLVDLADENYDLAIRTGKLEDKPGVIARRVARQRMIVCGSTSYLESNGHPLQVMDLSAHEAIIYSRSGVVRPWLFPRRDQPPEELTPQGRLRLDDLDAIADAAAAGLGLAWLPYWLVRERMQAGVLVALLADQPGYLYDCHALWLQAPHLPLRIRLAIDALATGLPIFMSGKR
jgi:DNA-binding transcriptional LysR family regulator